MTGKIIILYYVFNIKMHNWYVDTIEIGMCNIR